jgi:hypothetical protein
LRQARLLSAPVGYERRRNDMRFREPLKLHCSVA